jgi:hypothetical protein
MLRHPWSLDLRLLVRMPDRPYPIDPATLLSFNVTKYANVTGRILQVVSIALVPHNVTVALQGLPAGASAAGGELNVLTGEGPLAENSFQEPLKVRHIIMQMEIRAGVGHCEAITYSCKAGHPVQAAASVT